ncbi:MAG: OmpA family protein [Chlorobium sp.]
MKKKINGILVLPLLVLAGCSSEAALTNAGGSTVPENNVVSAVAPTPSAPVQSASVSSSGAALPAPSVKVVSPEVAAPAQSKVAAPPAQAPVSLSALPTTPAAAPAPITPALAPVAPAASSASPSLISQSGYGFDQWQKGPLGDVFFDFDSSVLGDNAKEQLIQNVGWLLATKSSDSVLVEGHCDSRGTSEYNLALGERRSTSVKEYLVRLGVPASRLEAVSFGEERPFAEGKSEEAMAKNRRAHFILQK